MATLKSSDFASDQEKWLAAKLLQRSHLKMFALSVCEKETQPKGTGTTSTFTRYKRMNVPLATLAEGVTPLASSFTLEQVTGGLDQWGDYLVISDLAPLTTKHPLMQLATELLADNAQRVIDREVQLVMLAGTNVRYGDGSVTTRATVEATHKVTDAGIHAVRVAMVNAGAPPRDGPANAAEMASASRAATGTFTGGRAYLGVTSAEVMADIMTIGVGSGLWQNVAMYQNAKATYSGEVGTYLGIRWVESNFIPKFTTLGGTTAAVVSTNDFGTGTPTVTANLAGGNLAASTTHYFKVTRKDRTRGFEEAISMEHTMATPASATSSYTFNFGSLSSDYAYNVYLGTTTGDANVKLAAENVLGGTSVTIGELPGVTAAAAPANLKVTATVNSVIHPIYILGAGPLKYTGFQQLKTYITGEGATKDDPLAQRRTAGYKFMAKALVVDQTRMLRWEVSSGF